MITSFPPVPSVGGHFGDILLSILSNDAKKETFNWNHPMNIVNESFAVANGRKVFNFLFDIFVDFMKAANVSVGCSCRKMCRC